ncbi:MAG: hypothetical protein EA396_06525 [Anaerolineaceae bacterium]|nr:MAG: hypothetical protein EA396_06525 [Anaerolineaceae bacterium]
MIDLPLFPLNLVLFPGMPLNLHIFEERYKIMIGECIDGRKPFGVVLIANKQPDTSRRAAPCLIGCTAQITGVQPLQEGRMNITAIGKDRFQVETFRHDKPYLSGDANLYPLAADISAQTRHISANLRHRLKRYLDILQRTRQGQFQTANIPRNPVTLAYLSAVLLQAEQDEKQSLLEADSLDDLIRQLNDIYRNEVTLLDVLMNPPDDLDSNGTFSLN